MKIGYLIGALEPGGAERQLAQLAVGMVRVGHDVTIISYSGKGELDSYVKSAGVKLICLPGGSKLQKIQNIRRWIASDKPDLIHGVMKRASSLAIIANLSSNCPVIASDYSTATYAAYKPSLWLSLSLFTLADRIITETSVNQRNIVRLLPLLKKKVLVIRNGVDTDRYQFTRRSYDTEKPFQFLCSGTVYSVKNPVNVVHAVKLLKTKTDRAFTLKWVGRTGLAGKSSDAFCESQQLIKKFQLESHITFAGHVDNVEDAYKQASALVHVSLQDGIPNAVVEAMATGLPVIVSRVSDLPDIVQHAENGMICSAEDPESIAEAMKKMLETPTTEIKTMSNKSAKVARDWFHRDRFIREHEDLYLELARQNVNGN